MLDNERLIIRQFDAVLRDHVFPNEVLPYLLCLTDDDCDQIKAKQRMEGPREAVSILLDRLKRREGSFRQFLTALEKTGCGHIKTKLENALRDQTSPETQHTNVTAETLKSQSDLLKTPTTETASPFSKSLPQTRRPITSDPPKNKSKPRKHKTPKENTTSPTNTKTCTSTQQKKSGSSASKTIPTSKNSCKKPKSPEMPSVKISQKTPATNSSCNQLSKKMDQIKISSPSETCLGESTATLYDTLVCYAEGNLDIASELKEFLETKFNLEVCIDFQNFIPGKATTDNICESITSSASIIFLLSHHFLTKDFAPWELKNAVYDSSTSKNGKCKKIIPVMLEECTVPKELEIYTAIKMEGCDSKEECWGKLAAAILDGNGVANEISEVVGEGVDDGKEVNDDIGDGTDDNEITDDGIGAGTNDGEIIDDGISDGIDDGEVVDDENDDDCDDDCDDDSKNIDVSDGETGGCEGEDNGNNPDDDDVNDCDEAPADDNDDDPDVVSDDVDYDDDSMINRENADDDMGNDNDKTKIKPVSSEDNVKSLQSL